jgi:hypothetical protein
MAIVRTTIKRALDLAGLEIRRRSAGDLRCGPFDKYLARATAAGMDVND